MAQITREVDDESGLTSDPVCSSVSGSGRTSVTICANPQPGSSRISRAGVNQRFARPRVAANDVPRAGEKLAVRSASLHQETSLVSIKNQRADAAPFPRRLCLSL